MSDSSQPTNNTTRPPFQFTLRRLFAWVTIVAGACSFVAWAAMAFRTPGEMAGAPQCATVLQSLVAYLKMHVNQRGQWPAAYVSDSTGKPIHSWRLDALASSIPKFKLVTGYEFSEPWDGPNNQRWLEEYDPKIFRCPKASGGAKHTSYVAVIGPDTMWPGATPGPSSQMVDPDTLLIVELPDSDIHWAEPRDITVDELWTAIQREAKKSQPQHAEGLHYATVGGEVRELPYDITKAELRELVKAKPRKAQ